MISIEARFFANDAAIRAWVFAIVGQPDAWSFPVLVRAAPWRVGDFNTNVLANTTWAYATTSLPDAQWFMALPVARVSD